MINEPSVCVNLFCRCDWMLQAFLHFRLSQPTVPIDLNRYVIPAAPSTYALKAEPVVLALLIAL